MASPADASGGLLADLPVYARGLMKIRVPVRVTLAAQRKSIQEIIELGPGSIVKFDKTCDEPLELSVGDRPIATGEVVKVGDKFGLRVGAGNVGPPSRAEQSVDRRSSVSPLCFAVPLSLWHRSARGATRNKKPAPDKGRPGQVLFSIARQAV